MSSADIIVLSLFALLTAPAAFLLLWILWRQTGNRAERDLALAVLANTFVLLGNLLTALAIGSPNTPDGVYLLLLDEVTIFTIMGGAYVGRFVYAATQTPLPQGLVVTFWIWAFFLHFLVLASVVLPPPPPASPSVSKGFALATFGALAMLLYASAVVVVGRRRILPDLIIPRLVRFTFILLALGILSAANDIFQFGRRIGGVAIPFSPFFAILVDGFIIVLASRRLVATLGHGKGTNAPAADFGLTLRETEILPLLLGGASNEEIGDRLNISPHTVKNHISVIFRKTGARNRFDLLKSFNRGDAD